MAIGGLRAKGVAVGVGEPVQRGQRRWPAATAVGLPAAVILAFLVAAWAKRWTVDDAFINYRVVDQLLAGNGPVFNLGERVEATTSTLWFTVLVVVEVVSPFSTEWSALVVELLLGAAGLGAGMAGALRLAGMAGGPDSAERKQQLVVPAGAAAYLGVAGSWDWATGGLENGLGMAWLGGGFWAVAVLGDEDGNQGDGRASRRRLGLTALLVGLGVLVRPDFLVYAVGLGVPLVAVIRRRRAWWALALGLALPAVVQVFRMGYYAQLVPNPLHTKESSRAWWSHGWDYLGDFAGSAGLVVPVAVVAVWLAATWRADGTTRDWRLVVAGIEGAAVLHTLGIVRAGGDYMHARLLLPAWFALLLPLFAVRVQAVTTRGRAAALAVLGAWLAVAVAFLRPPETYDVRPMVTTLMGPHPVTADEAIRALPSLAFPATLEGRPGYHTFGVDGTPAVYRSLSGRPVVAAEMLGVVGYVAPLDVWVHDRLGLADPVVSRVELTRRGRPGHEKILIGPWVAAAFVDPSADLPDDFATVNGFAANSAGVATPRRPESFDEDRAAATEALTCGELGELVHDTHAPLTPGRFLGNMVDAFSLHGFRFDADPQVARDELCGGE